MSAILVEFEAYDVKIDDSSFTNHELLAPLIVKRIEFDPHFYLLIVTSIDSMVLCPS